MAKPLTIPAGMIALRHDLLETALLSILLQRLLKGNAEAIALEGLADMTASSVEAVEEGLGRLSDCGAITAPERPWCEVSSIAPSKIAIGLYVSQYRLGPAEKKMNTKPHRYQTGEDEITLASGDRWLGVCHAIGDGEAGFEIQITKTHEGRLGQPEPIASPAPAYTERFETMELAWGAFDEYVQAQSSIMGWAAGLAYSNAETREVLLDAQTFDAALKEIFSERPVMAAGETEFDFDAWLEAAAFERRFERLGRLYVEHADGERFPHVPPAVESQEPALGESLAFSIELEDGSAVAVVYVENHTPAFSQFTFSGPVCESGEHVKQVKKKLVAEKGSAEGYALEYAEQLRARFTKGQGGGS